MSATLGVRVATAAVCDLGLARKNNEDAVLASSPVFIVADGLGGYDAGEVASAAVVNAFAALVDAPGPLGISDVRSALREADRRVRAVAATTKRGAGSTIAGAILVEVDHEAQWLVFNVGDSRVYRHFGTELRQLTIDHSLGQELVDLGELDASELATFEHRNLITRALGADNAAADSYLIPVVTGERLLICSDGLTNEVDDEGIRALLTMSGAPDSAVHALLTRALRSGGRDNVSAVVVDVLSGGADPQDDTTTDVRIRLGSMEEESVGDTTVPVAH